MSDEFKIEMPTHWNISPEGGKQALKLIEEYRDNENPKERELNMERLLATLLDPVIQDFERKMTAEMERRDKMKDEYVNDPAFIEGFVDNAFEEGSNNGS